ncbi:hypothetical protein P5V15_015883 [Pogonomyrmex californicus]
MLRIVGLAAVVLARAALSAVSVIGWKRGSMVGDSAVFARRSHNTSNSRSYLFPALTRSSSLMWIFFSRRGNWHQFAGSPIRFPVTR